MLSQMKHSKKSSRPALRRSRLAGAAMLLVAIAGLSACGDKEKKPGQALASVNGEEITVLQLNEELQRANVSAAQQATASKQALESLIDRQLLQNEAVREKTDRDPRVMQAIERAKALIVAQSYMQKRIGTPARPDKAEVAAYYEKNPVLFAQRKVLELKQLVFANKDLSDTLKTAIDGYKSIDEAAAWMEAHKVQFGRNTVSRATTDLPVELSSKLLAMPKGQLFLVREGDRAILSVVTDIKEAPVTLEQSAAQIEQFLYNKRVKQLSDAELARLRAAAKIEYLNKSMAPGAAPAAAPAAAPVAPAAAPAAASDGASANERGVAGLR